MQRTYLHSYGFKSNNTDIINALLPFTSYFYIHFCESVTNFATFTHGMIDKTNDQ